MDAKLVYHQLQELFPQVDPRILKAVSIEHRNDCDSAAEFIINEVLPTLGQPSKLISKSTRETNEESCYEGVLDEHREQLTYDKQVFETLHPKLTHREYGDLCDSAHIISTSMSKPAQIVNLEQDNCSSVYILEHMSTPVPHPTNSVTPLKIKEPIEIIDVEVSKYGNHNSSSFSPFVSEAEGKNMASIESNEIVTVERSSFVSHDVRGSGTANSEDSTNSSTIILNAKGKNIIDVDACYHHATSNKGESMALGTTASENVNTVSSGHEKLPTCCNAASSSPYISPSHISVEKFNELTKKCDDGAYDGCEEHLVKSLANGSELLATDNAAAEKTLASGHGEFPMYSSESAMEKFMELATKYADVAYDGCEGHLVKPLANDSEPLTTDNADAEKTLTNEHGKLPMYSSESAMEKFMELTMKYACGAYDGCEGHLVKPLADGSEPLTTDNDAAEKTLISGHGKLPIHSSHSAVENFIELTTNHDNGACFGCEELLFKPLANGSEALTANNDAAEKALPKLLTSRSGHVVNIDLLEDCVGDAKSSKMDLVFAVESVIGMIKEAEFLEEKCMQAKQEASDAGEEIFAKVNELKEMLQRAKQANDMHAGEIFGEKSVLITEARELQSRLLNLEDEKDKSLSIVEQMRKTLETRLEAARNEISAAEKEKVEKEGIAVKALMEQEAIMESVVQESKKLKEASDENAKLREFLDDRGRLVDTLEGEMAVVCEDVKSLKRRVDNVNSLNSAQSSSFSDKSSSALSSSEVLPEEQESLSKKNSRLAFMQVLESLSDTNCSNKASAAASWYEKSVSDEDDWEILRNEVGQL